MPAAPDYVNLVDGVEGTAACSKTSSDPETRDNTRAPPSPSKNNADEPPSKRVKLSAVKGDDPSNDDTTLADPKPPGASVADNDDDLENDALAAFNDETYSRSQDQTNSNGPDDAAAQKLTESQRLERLNYLVSQAGIFASLMSERLMAPSASAIEAPKSFHGKLHDYQLEGLRWLECMYQHGVNGILADEMGLGKTVQVIAFASFLRERQSWGPILIVCPLSCVNQWVSEFQRFNPAIPVLRLLSRTSLGAEYKPMVNNLLSFLNKQKQNIFPVIVTSYANALNQATLLKRFSWKYFVVDEGQRLKQFDCKLIQTLRKLSTENRLILSGTPLQTKLEELWSLLNFLIPEIFDDLNVFRQWFMRPNSVTPDTSSRSFGSANRNDWTSVLGPAAEARVVDKLHKILRPFMLRRVKKDVKLNIARKRVNLIFVPMTPLQKEYYVTTFKGTAALRDLVIQRHLQWQKQSGKGELPTRTEYARSSDASSTRTRWRAPVAATPINRLSDEHKRFVRSLRLTMAHIQRLKVCSHPFLFEDFPLDAPVDHDSGKMRLLGQLLPPLFARKHRVLVFCKMLKMLNILCEWADYMGWSYCRFDGSTTGDERTEQLTMFKEDSRIKLFFLITRSGGLGINLADADTVIIYESDWNPFTDLQAQDRSHRIGQKKPVVVYRLVTVNSIELDILNVARARRHLEKIVIERGKYSLNKQRTMTEEEDDLNEESAINFENISQKELRKYDPRADHLSEDIQVLEDGEDVLTREELDALLDRSDLVQEEGGKDAESK